MIDHYRDINLKLGHFKLLAVAKAYLINRLRTLYHSLFLLPAAD